MKEREQDGSKIVTGVRILRSLSNIKAPHQIANGEIDESQHLHSFFLNSIEFGKKKDYYVTTSEDEINVYDKN